MRPRTKLGLAILAFVATAGITVAYNARSTKGDQIAELSDGVDSAPAAPPEAADAS